MRTLLLAFGILLLIGAFAVVAAPRASACPDTYVGTSAYGTSYMAPSVYGGSVYTYPATYPSTYAATHTQGSVYSPSTAVYTPGATIQTPGATIYAPGTSAYTYPATYTYPSYTYGQVYPTTYPVYTRPRSRFNLFGINLF